MQIAANTIGFHPELKILTLTLSEFEILNDASLVISNWLLSKFLAKILTKHLILFTISALDRNSNISFLRNEFSKIFFFFLKVIKIQFLSA